MAARLRHARNADRGTRRIEADATRKLALPVRAVRVRLSAHITLLDYSRTMLAQNGPGERLGGATRGLLAAFALALLVILVVARRLEPDPRGYGTHERLGLWPCAFRATTGRPCPTCGMTTSFAWFVRSEPVRSWRANPAGSLLAPTSMILIPWLLLVSARGSPAPFRSLEQPLVVLAVAIVALTLVSWTVRMTFGGSLG
jgi:hypothetical protein